MIRVLVVDDSAVVRNLLTAELSKFADIEVVGSAVDPYAAREKIVALNPDVLTLDVEMPRMDGLTFLSKLMKHHPIPVVIVSSVTPEHSDAAVRALSLGAVEVVPKPGSAFSIPDVSGRLVRAIRAAAVAAPARLARPVTVTEPVTVGAALGGGSALESLRPSLGARVTTTHKIFAIGASTGGTRALEVVLRALPPDAPGTVIVQHMPAGFTASFAERLNGLSRIEVREARDGDVVTPGVALIAPGGLHMALQQNGAQYVVRLKNGPMVQHQRPSVDVLFHSVARTAGRNAVGAILTGMGSDGASGLLAMREAGARTFAEHESTCIVYGMPKSAMDNGAAESAVPLPRVAEVMLAAL